MALPSQEPQTGLPTKLHHRGYCDEKYSLHYIPFGISDHVADWALVSLLKHLEPQPILKAHLELTVQQV